MFFKHIFAHLLLVVATSAVATHSATAQTLYGSAGSLQARENAHNADWAYNWANVPTHNGNAFSVDVANYEFVPMIWSATTSGVSNQINTILNLENNFDVHVDYVLGFNEPELSSQSNMTVQQALDVWEIMTDQFSQTDIKLVSPAVSGGGAIRVNPDGWLTEFMHGVETANNDADPDNDLQVDAIAYHYYTVGFNGVTEANRLLDQIDDLWERYQLPIWITEFAGTSFSADNPIHSLEERQAFNRAFLQRLIPEFDARPYVERVSWWQFGAGVSGGSGYSRLSTVSGGIYTPSIIGEVYMRTTMDAGETYDFATENFRPTYVHYLKGSNLANNGPMLPEALRALDVMEGNTVMSGSGDFGFENDDDAFVRIRAGNALRKQGNNTVFMPSLPIFNEGAILIEGGTLLLEDGTQLTGSGSLQVNAGGTLATSSDSEDNEVRLELSSIDLNQGALEVQDGVTTISETLNLLNASQVRTQGNLVISGATTGGGMILATGDGALYMNGTSTHTGGAQVTAGQLVVANTAASSIGSGNIVVGGSGTLGGFGQIDGSVNAVGGTVAPGVDQTPAGETSTPSFDPGVIVDAIDFDFTGVQDNSPLTQTSTLNGLRVVSGFSFGPSVRPRGVGNDGNEFNVAGFRSDTNNGAAINAGDYLTFTIAPVEGLAMIIEDVDFQLRRNGGGAAQQYMVASSIDGFSFPTRWGLQTITDTATHDLSFSNIGSDPISDAVEIRISGTEASSDFGNTHFYAVSVDASFESDPNSVAFDPTGIMELGGNYTQAGFARLEADLGGTQPGEFDQLQVAGNVTLAGTLDVSMIDGFEPTAGQTFDIITANSITGTFSTVIVPDGMDIQVIYSNSAVSLQVGAGLVGDFDGDGDVDVDDIDFYAGSIGSPATGALAQLDFDGNGQVTSADLQIHVETYVQTSNNQTGTFLGDLNLDGTVNVLGDAFVLISSLGNSVSSYGSGDINLDGTVNVLGDAFALISNLGMSNGN